MTHSFASLRGRLARFILTLLLLSLITVACSDETPVSNGPTPTGTTASTSTGTPSGNAKPTANIAPPPTVAVSDEAKKSLETVGEQAAKIRQLSFKSGVEKNFMSRTDLAAFQKADFERDNPPAVIERSQKTLQIFGFVKPGFDLQKTYVDLLSEQVLGFYDPRTKKLYIITDDPQKGASPLAKFTAEHELTHALQDQNFDLQKIRASRKPEDKEWNDDADYAVLALVEGDAVQSQYNWLFGNSLKPQELQELQKEIQDSLAQSSAINSAPLILKDTLEFPYTDGNSFVKLLQDKGGWNNVNKAWRDYLPKSTSQILHPDKYEKRVEPVKVELAGLTDALGGGWNSVDINTFGELQTRIWLNGVLPKDQATKAADGWAGDRYQVLENGGKYGYAFRSIWDSEAEANEFYTASTTYITKNYGLNGDGGGGKSRSWQSADLDIKLIQKGKEVLVVAMPKGEAAGKVVSKLGF